MTRLIATILALGLLAGCSAFPGNSDEIAISGQGVLASYSQSIGELTDLNRVETSVKRRQSKPVDLALNPRYKELADFNDLILDNPKLGKAKSGGLIRFQDM